MTYSDFQQLSEEIMLIIRQKAPKDTGNLAYNSIRLEWIDDNTFKIYVDESIAPYMPYTNEPWISPKWNGKQNPNEAWWQKIIEEIINYIVDKYNGEVE